MNGPQGPGARSAQAQQSRFVACDFARAQGDIAASIRWTDPETVVTSVTLPDPGPAKTFQRTWQGRPPGAERLQQTFAIVRDRQTGTRPVYTLRLLRSAQTVATLSWSADQETERLAELRSDLERLGHLPCTQAMAYWKRGHLQAGGGSLAEAIRSFQEGLKSLGNAYQDPDTLDDTGTKLVLAQSHERQGKLAPAAGLLEGILKARVDTYIRLRAPQSAAQAWAG